MPGIIAIGRWHYLIPSESRPGEYHSLDLEEMTCSCPGSLVHGNCWHLARFQALKHFQEVLPAPVTSP